MKLSEFNLKYKYKKDKHESWKPCEIIDGLYQGDCEDYCLSLQDLVEGMSKYKLYYCKSPRGRGHCILGDGKQFIECGYQRMEPKEFYIKKGYTKIKKFFWLDVWYRKISTKLFGRALFIGR